MPAPGVAPSELVLGAALLVVTGEVPVLPSPGSSELAQIITAALAGIAALVTASAAAAGLRRRRAAELAASPVGVALDPEDTTARLRERLTRLESEVRELRGHKCGTRLAVLEERAEAARSRLDDLDERMDLRRATDLAVEQHLRSPRTRTRRKDPET